MPLNKYAILIRAAEVGNLTAVANEIEYTQSAISHSIRSLEKELGIPLIRRSKSGISLTPQGEELLPAFRQVVNAEEYLFQKAAQFRGLQSGTLRVGSFTSVSLLWIPAIAKKIATDYPDVRLIQSHLLFDAIAAQLASGDIDVGFLTESDRGSFDFIPLYEDEYYAIIPPEHPLAALDKIPFEALDGERIILMQDGGRDLDSLFRRIRDPRIVHNVSEDILALPLVEAGIGITILPGMIADYFPTSAAKRHFTQPCCRTIGLAAKSFKDAPPLAGLFIDLIREHLNKM